MGLTMLGVGALERGDAQAARTFFEEDLGVLRRLRDKTGTSYGLRGMAGVAALRGDATRAARLWGADEALREEIGQALSPFDRAHPETTRACSTPRASEWTMRLGGRRWRRAGR